jgi:hypothetical protein
MRTRVLPSLLVALVAALGTAAGATPAVSAAVLPATPSLPVTLPAAVEDTPAYQPQTFCDPRDKKGVVAFGRLLTTTYPDTTVVDISRGCTSESGTSEHKDGRALDWGVSYKNPAQVKEVQAVFGWLFAKDASGTPNAMLRRLGIMYIIWNKKIWGSWSQSWQDYSCSGVTACHQDHVHFSFDWAGALGKTSFWTGQVAGFVPPPTYVYTSRSFAQVAQVSSRAASVTTPFLVQPGLPYKLTVTGTYRPSADPLARADAECSTRDGKTWTSLADGDTSSGTGRLDLWVNGHRAWSPTPSTGGGCNTATHTYTRTLTFPTKVPLQLSIADPTHGDDHGSLSVTIQRV